jgi:hypothetical protein
VSRATRRAAQIALRQHARHDPDRSVAPVNPGDRRDSTEGAMQVNDEVRRVTGDADGHDHGVTTGVGAANQVLGMSAASPSWGFDASSAARLASRATLGDSGVTRGGVAYSENVKSFNYRDPVVSPTPVTRRLRLPPWQGGRGFGATRHAPTTRTRTHDA